MSNDPAVSAHSAHNPFRDPETHYAPPPGEPPEQPEAHYAPPPGPPPAQSDDGQYQPHYAPPPGPPPPDPLDQPNPAEAPPPYSKTPPAFLPETPDTPFITITLPPTPPTYRPLDPPPPCFSTPSPLRVHSHSFAPFRVPSNTSRLADGFQPLYPPELLGKHGISEADWARFLADIRITAQLAEQGMSAVAPYRGTASAIVMRAGNVGRQYDSAFAKTPVDEVRGLLQVWNESAFERRKMRVTLVIRADETNRRREGYDLLVDAL
ncbi:hypothetical protein GLOTRDRAFT_94621 [Gloeophyllum trabeum ATCC 11539]|uniref:Uncharacterized protein n=1 Tax=Gloeophyllum trabeum (strain ATCC 11539 / FP-39264 / Madison 617) TaxID=670483 RepID=S7Q470_GLOTA|nr:uncharacterized protein GLOTRDRAFT_94621 [Gloeophyllum trabeum ATCC 11539]EPQ54317.1 hypothetical protein GLOTRDRAFT_94621 [Gloeophyllum trabeum ATCC 11539]